VHEQSDDRGGDIARSGPSPTLIAVVVVAILVAILIIQNSHDTELELLFVDFSAPTWVAFLIALVLGALLDRLITMWWRRRKRRQPA
jgi:uncharacterized integral membrane protein